MWNFIADAGPIAIIAVAAAMIWMTWEMKRAPTCQCGREDCGGGCGLV